MNPIKIRVNKDSSKSSAKSSLVVKKKLGEGKPDESEMPKKWKKLQKKVLYIEIDDEVTAIYDRMRHLKMKNIYMVVPKRAILFQSIVNLKILKRKAADLNKNIFIITNDQNGMHLAAKIDLPVYDKIEGHEHPSLVSGKFLEEQQNITPLKASINSMDDDTPTRRNEKKFSITELIRKKRKLFQPFNRVLNKTVPINQIKQKKQKQKEDKGKLVLVAPNRHALVSLVILSILVLVIITYIALPGATIILTPRSNVIDVSVNVTLADIEKNRAELDTHPIQMIPSYTMTTKIEKVFNYQSTGKEFKGENAKGTLTIINESGNEWPLIARTRFQTAEGLVFRISNAVNVPPKRGNENGKLNVQVVADEVDAFNQVIGEKGNIGPSRFFLPGLSDENQKRLYAQSTETFSGGNTVVTKLITEEDLTAARNKMSADLKAAAEAELKLYITQRNEAQKSNLELLTGKDAIATSEPKVTIPANLVGQKIETFEVRGEMVASGTAFNKNDLLGILKTELKLKKSPQKSLHKIDEASLSYKIVETDKNAGKLKITANLKGIEEFEISPDKENGKRLIKKIKDHILGKDINEAELYIQNLPEVDKVKIESWPAWSPSLPGIPDNIKIEVRRS
jgi:hypothetical protein